MINNLYKLSVLVLLVLIVESRLSAKSDILTTIKGERILVDDEESHDQEYTSQEEEISSEDQDKSDIFITPNHGQDSQNHDTNQSDQHHQEHQEHRHLQPNQAEFWYAILLSLLLTCVGAFCSGMTVGFLSISKLELQMMSLKKNQEQSRMAKAILNVLSDHHLFLVTLLVYNAIALQSLPIVIHSLMPDWAAILFSTLIVLVVAEIVPQAYCTGEKKIVIAYYASPVVMIMMRLLYFIIWPIAKGLDKLLGVHHENERINKKDMKVFLNEDKFLKESEKMLLTSTLQLRGIKIKEAMVDIKKIYMIQENQSLGEQRLEEIRQRNYSYVLVYKQKRTNITGVIKIKELVFQLLMSQKKQFKAGEVMKSVSKLITVYEDTNLLEMLMLFQAKSIRIGYVCNIRKKIDPNIQSIMYSKSEMVLQDKAKQAEIIGIVFLHQIFDTMADIKQTIQHRSQMHLLHEGQQYQMHSLGQPLLRQ